MTCPVDHLQVVEDIAHYLHTQGVVRDPIPPQTGDNPLPAVWVGGLRPDVDHALGIIGPWQDNPDSDASPIIRFMIVARTKPDDLQTLIGTSQNIFHALHHPDHPFPLTARQDVMFCRRIVSDPPVQDENRRWIRVETYQARLTQPNTI